MKKPTVDTSFAGSWAETMQNRRPVTGIVDPRTVPIQFQEEQRRMNIQKRLWPGYSRADVERMEQEELKEFPRN